MVKRLISIVGPNASGKSALAVVLAKRFGGEVLSADSRQVFRGLDLGTGKFTTEEMGGIRHHLIDVADIGSSYSVAAFQASAYDLIESMQERGVLPILAGGTGLYVRAVVRGFQFPTGSIDPDGRAELEQASSQDLVARLHALNPELAARVDTLNRRRLVRALEIATTDATASLLEQSPRYQVLQLGLKWDREVLRERIANRLRARLDAGMVAETQALLDRGVSTEVLHSLGLEYRYIAWWLEGKFQTQEEFETRLAAAIWQVAKRQMRWFRADPETVWLDTSADYSAEAMNRVEVWMEALSDDV